MTDSTAQAGPIGLAMDEGARLLHDHAAEIWWHARSKFLCAGCDVLPAWRFQDRDASDQPTARTPRVVLGFEVGPAMREWSRRNTATIAMPPPELTLHVGDKTWLPELAAAAGVAVPRSVVARKAQERHADALWGELGAARAVAQLAENDLTGQGTRPISDVTELAACLAMWTGHDVKLAEYVAGIPLTVSGVVLPHATAVSGISHQLVGHPRLTPIWGAHCGNQLIVASDLPDGTATASYDVCRRIGEQLRACGFLGMFGLDLLATDAGVVVLEVNPRVQSVTSLLNAADVAAGVLPAPALHVLALTATEPVSMTPINTPAPAHGQLVMYARTAGTLAAAPRSGLYELSAQCARVGDPVALGSISAGQALVWSMASPGSQVRPTDRLYVVQTPGPVASTSGELTTDATNWLAALDRLFRIEGAHQ